MVKGKKVAAIDLQESDLLKAKKVKRAEHEGRAYVQLMAKSIKVRR